mmetsp:Transcript_18922/g.33840  ORF Transcript_18922/g.33840 Transcript_18922/m.33840 type:complete len:222 (+) Transcript_18922:418-1083(+)
MLDFLVWPPPLVPPLFHHVLFSSSSAASPRSQSYTAPCRRNSTSVCMCMRITFENPLKSSFWFSSCFSSMSGGTRYRNLSVAGNLTDLMASYILSSSKPLKDWLLIPRSCQPSFTPLSPVCWHRILLTTGYKPSVPSWSPNGPTSNLMLMNFSSDLATLIISDASFIRLLWNLLGRYPSIISEIIVSPRFKSDIPMSPSVSKSKKLKHIFILTLMEPYLRV